MRIIYFSRDYTPHDHRFLSALAESEHQVFYLRLERRGHQLEDRPLPPKISQIRWVGGQAPANWRDGLRLLFDLQRVIKEVKPDLIHAGPIQNAALLVALADFRPLVSMSWGYDLLHDADRNALWCWTTRFALKRSAVMVGDCETIRQRAMALGMPDDRVVTFPWGVDLSFFSPGLSNLRKDQAFTLLSTRSWEPIYGVDVLAKAFVQVAQQRPEARLLMLGNGSQATRLRRIFIDGGVLEQVILPGQVGQAELPRYYRAADLYLSASHSDGSSVSLMEAMACGCPALVSDIPGNREWVRPDVQGWWFPDDDAGALAEGILNAMDERQRLPEMGRAARQLAEQRADWLINFQELLRAYKLAMEVTA